MYDAYCDAADYDENHNRAIACEVLARRIVHITPPDRINSVMSTRYRHRQLDGDTSDMASALEMAVDSHCTIFLSSSEAQDVVLDLWRGELIQKNNEHHDIDYISYTETRDSGFWAHLDPARISVPRYQIREPLERLTPDQNAMDPWEYVLYTMSLSFAIEDTVRLFKILRIATYRAINFWTVVSAITDGILLAAFILRVIDLNESDNAYRIKSFQVLSFVSPFIWCLLSVLALGFGQGLYALDAADGETDSPVVVVDDAEAEYLAFFAGKTVGMIRAPDSYVYPAPFNLIELVFVAPIERLLSPHTYNKLNRLIMSLIFFPTLAIIALYESSQQGSKNRWVKNWFIGRDQADSGFEDPKHQDPEVEGEDAVKGLEISRVPFAELIKVFPNTHQSSEATILKEVKDLKEVVQLLLQKVDDLSKK
ncbi:hypothetical protein HWV62_35029 [Athelia sp. TMB]|nr:hypothetical protein HWV62_35029 [Athelia sp. TMB]